MTDLAALARTTLARSRFMVLGSADPHTGQAVYLEATAGRVPDDELADACASAFRDVDDTLSFTPQTLRDEPFVLYRARVTASEIHVRGPAGNRRALNAG